MGDSLFHANWLATEFQSNDYDRHRFAGGRRPWMDVEYERVGRSTEFTNVGQFVRWIEQLFEFGNFRIDDRYRPTCRWYLERLHIELWIG